MSINNRFKTCLVTGGAGFIGSHLVEKLLEKGYHVRVLDNFSSGNKANIEPFLTQIDLIKGDIRDFSSVEKACDGIDIIFHQAAIASVYHSIQHPCLTHEVNVTGTLHVLEAARQSSVKQVNLASSAAVYGLSEVLPKAESMSPAPVSPYGFHKLINEQYARLYAEQYGLNTVCFRYFNVFGPRQDAKSPYSGVISIFIDAILSGKDPVIYGDGHQSRDFISIHDICQANLLAMEASNLSPFEVFNIGSGRAYSLLELLEQIQMITGQTFRIRHAEERRGDLRHSVANISHIKEMLGYKPHVPFQQGLTELIQSVRMMPYPQQSEKLVS